MLQSHPLLCSCYKVAFNCSDDSKPSGNDKTGGGAHRFVGRWGGLQGPRDHVDDPVRRHDVRVDDEAFVDVAGGLTAFTKKL